MSISVDTINLRFNVKPDYDQQQLQQLQEDLKNGQKELEKTRRAMDKLAKNGLNAMTKEERNEFDRLSKTLTKTAREVHENERKMKEWTRTADINKLSIQQLGQRAKDLTAVLNNLNPTTDEFREYKEELDAVKERMKELRTVAHDTEESLGKFNKLTAFTEKLNVFGFAITNSLEIKDRIVAWADQYVQEFARMDDAMTDVMKYTGQTKAEVEDMNEEFKKMTTRTAREELNALAGAAGRLGIQGKENIVGFVDAADKINVALGDDLGEGAIDQIGKLTMVFGEDKTKGLNGAMLATGSAINELGANSSANTGFITQFTSRVAGMAVQANIAQTDIMGYASALSQAGVEGETASGVFAQFVTKMFTDPAKFAKAAGIEVKAFTDLLKNDANQAILQFLEAMQQKGGFDQLAPMLKSLKMQGTQAIPVLTAMAGKLTELKEAQRLAAEAYNDGTSIIKEFNNANSSAAAKLEIEKKKMTDAAAALGQQLLPVIQSSMTATTSFLKVITPLLGVVANNIGSFMQLAAAIAAYYTATNIAAIKTALLTAKMNLAANATRLWNAAMATSPIGLFAAGLTLIGTEMLRYAERAREAKRVQDELNESMTEAKKEIASERAEMDQLIGVVKSATSSENERREALEKLNGKLMSLHLGNLTEEMVRTGDLTEVLDAYNRKLETQIKLKRLQARQEDLINRKIDIEEGGYEDDISFGDRIAQGAAALGQSLISGHLQGFRTAFGEEWDRVEESFKNRALRPILEGLDTVEDRIAEIKAQEEAAANTVNYIGTVTVHGSKGPKAGAGGDGNNTTAGGSRREKERKEQEAQAKAAYEQELLNLKKAYQNRQGYEDEWQRLNLAAEERYLVKKGEILKKYNASQSDIQEWGNQVLDLEIKKGNQQREEQQKETNRKIQTENYSFSAIQIEEARKRLEGLYTDEEAFDIKMQELEIEHQQKILAIRRAAGEDVSNEEKTLLDKMYQLKKRKNAKEETDITSSQNDANEWLKRVEMQGESFDKMRELNEKYYNDGRISYQQYQENLNNIAQQESDKRQQIEQAAIDGVSNLLSSASSLFSAMQQRETAAVDAKYKKMIAAAKKQGKDTTKLEEQQKAEKQAVAKKYADRNFKIQVLQIIANTAQGISKTIAEFGMPWAIPFVAMAAAAGAMQLASAKAAADQAAGLYSGGFSDNYQEGYTKKGDPKKEAGVIPVHQNEFVANHKAVANPEVRPLLDVIDRHQKLGDIHMLDATRMLEEAYGRGRYRGGYSTDGHAPAPSSSNSGEERYQQGGGDNQEMMQLLRTIARNTSESFTIRDVRKEIRHEEQLERNASR